MLLLLIHILWETLPWPFEILYFDSVNISINDHHSNVQTQTWRQVAHCPVIPLWIALKILEFRSGLTESLYDSGIST